MKARKILARAAELYDAGNLEGAARECRRLLKSEPRETEALYLLGVISHQTGNQVLAEECMRRALAITPHHADCWNILGLATLVLGKDEEAAASFERAIELGDSHHFCNNLGSLRKKQGRLDEALAAYRQALGRNPGFADTHFNLGSIYREKGEWQAAAECFRSAIEANPGDAEAWVNLAQALRALNRSEDAVQVLEKAIAQVAGNADLYCEWGDALGAAGRLENAIAAYTQALQLDPASARAWFSAGAAHSAREEDAAAIRYFEKALEIAPDWAAAQHDLAKALFNLGQVDEALDFFRKALAGDRPLLPLSMIALIIPGSSKAGNQDVLDARRAYARYLPQATPKETTGEGSNQRSVRTRPIRIGYISSFFQFPNWMKPVWALVNHHDRSRFEVHLFSDAPASSIERGYRAHSQDHFHDITGIPNETVARSMEEAGIDILVDLNGYSKMPRLGLVAMHPAPVVVGWFNMYATSGISSYDYLIGDDVVIPAEEEKFYSEKILRVPGSYLTFEVGYPVPDVADSSRRGRDASGVFTFGCLASQYKITRDVVAAWCRILQEAPASRLILKNAKLGCAENQRYVRGLFEAQGIAQDRLRLEGPSDHYEFLKTYGTIDLALDTFPYNGGTTTTEAIWQGVPVLAFRGDRWAARTSASLLEAGNLGRFVARSADDYIAQAIQFASFKGAEELSELRQDMRSTLRNSPACDTESFARNMEALYSKMFNTM